MNTVQANTRGQSETKADLVRREGRDYESASVLLERIAAEQAAGENGKPRRAKDQR